MQRLEWEHTAGEAACCSDSGSDPMLLSDCTFLVQASMVCCGLSKDSVRKMLCEVQYNINECSVAA